MDEKNDGSLKVDRELKRVGVILGWMLVVAGACYTFYLARRFISGVFDVLTPFLAAAVLAYILDPIVTKLQRRFGVSRVWGMIVCWFILLFAFVVFMGFLAPIIYRQGKAAYVSVSRFAPSVLDQGIDFVSSFVPEEVMETLTEDVSVTTGTQTGLNATPEDAATTGTKVIRRDLMQWAHDNDINLNDLNGVLPATHRVLEAVWRQVSIVVSGIWGGAGSAISLGAMIVFVVIISFYFIVDFDKFGYFTRVIIPEKYEERVFVILGKMDSAVGGFLRGQIIVCFCVGAITTIGLLLLGFHTPALAKYCLLIGIVAGVANFIPYLGPILGAAPAVLIVLFAQRPEDVTWTYVLMGLAGVGILSAVTQTIEGFVLQPYVVGTNSELHPLVVMLALIAGAQFGLGGMIVAVPIAAMARVLVKELWWDERAGAYREGREKSAPKSG